MSTSNVSNNHGLQVCCDRSATPATDIIQLALWEGHDLVARGREEAASEAPAHLRPAAVEPHRNRLQGLLLDLFEKQRNSFPYRDLAAILAAPERREQPVPQERIEELLAVWLAEAAEEMQPRIREALLDAAESGFLGAVAAWFAVISIDAEVPEHLLAKVDHWLSFQENPVTGINEKTRRAVAQIVLASARDGWSISDIRDRVNEYFTKGQADFARIYAWLIALMALHQGIHVANKALGARTKRWLIRPGLNNCETCLKNQAQGPIPLAEAFESGHQWPPVHFLCGCWITYGGVTRRSVIDALEG